MQEKLDHVGLMISLLILSCPVVVNNKMIEKSTYIRWRCHSSNIVVCLQTSSFWLDLDLPVPRLWPSYSGGSVKAMRLWMSCCGCGWPVQYQSKTVSSAVLKNVFYVVVAAKQEFLLVTLHNISSSHLISLASVLWLWAVVLVISLCTEW